MDICLSISRVGQMYHGKTTLQSSVLESVVRTGKSMSQSQRSSKIGQMERIGLSRQSVHRI
eukprot:8906113-Karenia_brevis.AAC.1